MTDILATMARVGKKERFALALLFYLRTTGWARTVTYVF